MSFGKRLQKARDEAGLTQEYIGKLFNPSVTRNTVSNWERDENMPEPDKLPAISRAVRQSIDFLLTGKNSSANTIPGPDAGGRVPLISWVQAGSYSQVVDNLHPGDAEEWIETRVPVHQHTYALRVQGDSMTNPTGTDPTFPNGSIIVVEPDAIGSPSEMVGRFVIVRRNGDDEATFKQLVKDGNELLLRPLNPQYPMIKFQETDQICGVVRSKELRFF